MSTFYKQRRGFSRTSLLLLVIVLLIIGYTFSRFTSPNSPLATQATAPAGTMQDKWVVAMESQSGGKDEIDGLTVDTQGNVVFTGPYDGTVTIGGKQRTAQTDIDAFITMYDKNGKEVWFTSIDSGGYDFIWDLTSDKDDNLYITGGYGGSLTINGNTYTASRDGSAFVAKIDNQSGDFIWFRPMGIKGNTDTLIRADQTTGANEIKVDSQGDIVFQLTAFGGEYTIGDDVYQPFGQRDSFIIKLSPTGEFLWTYQFVGSGHQQLRAIGINGNNDIVFGHEAWGTVATPEGDELTGSSARTKYGSAGMISTDGELMWITSVTSEGFANVRGAGGSSGGDVFITGEVTGAGTLAGEPIQGLPEGAAFLARMSDEGKVVWVRVLGNDEFENGGEMVVGENDVTVISGTNRGDNYHLYTGTGALLAKNIHTLETYPGAPRGTLTYFSADGDLLNTYTPIASDMSSTGELEFTPDGCVAVAIIYRGTIEFSTGDTYASGGKKDGDEAVSVVCPIN